ncbi:MAG: AAA family ATPase [Clostridia bacterium]|nr:AAA family ATPase [Clostridia bacterium]
MKKLLLITGDLAAGKSTFAEILNKRYDTNLFFKDSIKEVLGDAIGFSSREENLRLSRASMDLMLFIFSEFAKLNKDLILESNFHTAELERLHQTADENGYDALTVVIRGDAEILHQRFMNRIQNKKRHPAHLSVALDDPDAFKRALERSREERVPGNVIRLNADDFSYQTDAAVLAQIDAFMLG